MTTLPIRKKFKKFSDEFIPDIVEYIKNEIEKNPYLTISVGCDSIQRKRKTLYTVTIMLYNGSEKNGAHVVFFRENLHKVRDNFERLHKEADYIHQVGELLITELGDTFCRKDLTDLERKRYKFHLSKCNGEVKNLSSFDEQNFINNIQLTDFEKIQDFKLVDLHVDFNPFEGELDKRGNQKNKSNVAYKSFVPWLRGLGYRVFAKPMSYASTNAADILLKN
jgi:predicted RNase H-related nuclease YkuK (DUF458 family)